MTATARSTVLFLARPAGIGGSVRSLATVLQYTAVRRAVAMVPATSTAALVDERGLADEVVWLDTSGSAQRMRTAHRLLVWAIRHRRSLLAVHANGVSDLHLVAPIALVLRRPTVVWIHEGKVSGRTREALRFWARTLPRLHLRYVSGAQQAEIGIMATRGTTDVAPNPIDPADVVGPRAARTEGRLAAGFLGTPAPYKGFHLLPSIIRATRDVVSWHVFAGPRSAMTETWHELDGLEDVEQHGKLREVATAYGMLDIVVCPSFLESFGRVVAEAMLNGIPVVAFDVPAVAQLVEDGQDGVLVDVGDVDAMVKAIRSLVAYPRTRAAIGTRARERAASFAPAAIAASFDRLYTGDV